jgi:hypothetical protein
MTFNPALGAYLESADVTKDGMPNRTWFDLAVARSKGAIALARKEIDNELDAITRDVREGYSDHTDYGEYV